MLSAKPAGETRAERRARRRTEAQLRRADAAQPKTDEATEAGMPAPVDVAGVAAAGTYWNPLQVAQPAHRATSPNLAGAVPFVADADLGHAGPILGLNATTGGIWHFDPWELYASKQINSTNVLVIGEFGTGKSGTIKQLCFRSLAFGRQVVVPSDSKGEWVKVAEAAGGQVIRLGGKHTTARLNPLDRGPRAYEASDDEHEVMVASRRRAVLVSLVQATLPADALLTPAEHTALEFALACAIDASGDEPTLRGVYEQLKNPNRDDAGYIAGIEEDGARARHVLRRFCEGDLAGLFEDESTVQLDDNAPMVVVDTSALFARGELAATCAQICTTNWIQAVISNKHARRTRFLVREEGWRDMTSVAALQAFRAWLKLSRDYGISVVTLMHKVSDFDAVGAEGSEARSLAYSIFADISNKFIFQQAAAEQGRLVKDLGLPQSHARMVLDLPQGVFLARLGSRRAFVVDAFATSVAIERDLFSTDDALAARPQVAAADAHPPTPTPVSEAIEVAPAPPTVEPELDVVVDQAPSAGALASELFGGRAEEIEERTIMVPRFTRARFSLVMADGLRVALTADDVILGRRPTAVSQHPSAQLVAVSDATKTMSKNHAHLRREGAQWTITDLASTNGVAMYAADGTETVLPSGVPTIVTGDVALGQARMRVVQDAVEAGAAERAAAIRAPLADQTETDLVAELPAPLSFTHHRALRLVASAGEQTSPGQMVLPVACDECGFMPSSSHRFCMRCGATLAEAVS